MDVVINLKEYLLSVLEEYPSPHAMAKDNGWSYGLVYRGLTGHESATLRKQIGCVKYPPRHRLIFECGPEIKTLFDNLRGDIPRAEFLTALLDCWQGHAELRY